MSTVHDGLARTRLATLRAGRLRAGLCQGCGIAPHDPGHFGCPACRAKWRAAKWQKFCQGVCRECRAAIPLGTRHCPVHQLTARIRTRTWRDRGGTSSRSPEVTVSDRQWYRLTGERR